MGHKDRATPRSRFRPGLDLDLALHLPFSQFFLSHHFSPGLGLFKPNFSSGFVLVQFRYSCEWNWFRSSFSPGLALSFLLVYSV